jgi:adenylate cyclase
MNDASIADILKVYLGQNAGEAVLAGNMSRGKSFKVTAAVLIVDIRGSTPLLQKLGTDSYIDIINKLFDIVTPHVRANDGEVLQFTGDGMLAVFPESAEAKVGGYMCPIAIQNAYTAAVGADKAILDGTCRPLSASA